MQAFVCFQDAAAEQRYASLPERLGFAAVTAKTDLPVDCTHVCWASDDEGLAFGAYCEAAHQPAATSVRLDDPALLYRLKTSGKHRGLGKALGLHKHVQPWVVDATAGLGRDAVLMAYLGCQVTMLEREPLIHALLEDALLRARESEHEVIRELLPRLQLFPAEARHWLQDCSPDQLPDVIYLDPMFPSRSKSARVKKDMALLQEVLGHENDFDSLLAAARQSARKRVVVKRPGSKPDPGLPAASHIIAGKTAHYAVYLNSTLA